VPAVLAVNAIETEYRFGEVRALDGLSLEIPRGITTAVLGPNGAGKSTFIRLLVGLLTPHSGSVEVLGETPSSVSSRVGYMPQASALYEELSGRENIDFHARIYGIRDREQRRVAVQAALTMVEMTDVAERQIFKLSGGMRQRISLACALAHSPDLLVLDEPTVGLDPRLRTNLWDLFREQATAGKTLIISSHTMDDAAHCERLIFLREGRVIADGSPSTLIADAGVTDGSLERAFLHFAEGGSMQ
jgi:ABC-2 type transport system ATP-binding protein